MRRNHTNKMNGKIRVESFFLLTFTLLDYFFAWLQIPSVSKVQNKRKMKGELFLLGLRKPQNNIHAFFYCLYVCR